MRCVQRGWRATLLRQLSQSLSPGMRQSALEAGAEGRVALYVVQGEEREQTKQPGYVQFKMRVAKRPLRKYIVTWQRVSEFVYLTEPLFFVYLILRFNKAFILFS